MHVPMTLPTKMHSGTFVKTGWNLEKETGARLASGIQKNNSRAFESTAQRAVSSANSRYVISSWQLQFIHRASTTLNLLITSIITSMIMIN